jgi:hypothetical protein
VKHKKRCTLSPLFMFHYTQSCTSCTLSPLFYVSLESCTSCTLSPLFKWGDNIYEVQLCVVKYKKNVTMYMKYSSVCSEIWKRGGTLSSLFYVSLESYTSCTLSPLFYISLHKAVLHAHCRWQCTWSTAVCSEI